MWWCGYRKFASIHILCIIITAFFTKKQNKICHISNKAAALQTLKQKFQRDWLFWSSLFPKTAMKTCLNVIIIFDLQAGVPNY